MASPFQASAVTELRDNVSCSHPFRGGNVILDFPHYITHLLILLSAATIPHSLHLYQAFPPLEGMLGLATVLV